MLEALDYFFDTPELKDSFQECRLQSPDGRLIRLFIVTGRSGQEISDWLKLIQGEENKAGKPTVVLLPETK